MKTQIGAATPTHATEFAATARRATVLLCAPSICLIGLSYQVTMVTTMQVVTEHEGDYFVVEVYSDDNRLLIRVGFDYEPTQDEIDDLLQQFVGGEE
jgi:hypothetical protein